MKRNLDYSVWAQYRINTNGCNLGEGYYQSNMKEILKEPEVSSNAMGALQRTQRGADIHWTIKRIPMWVGTELEWVLFLLMGICLWDSREGEKTPFIASDRSSAPELKLKQDEK